MHIISIPVFAGGDRHPGTASAPELSFRKIIPAVENMTRTQEEVRRV